MTAIAGILHFDGTLPDQTSAQRLRNAIAPFGKDRQDSLNWGNGHFLRALLRTTPEDSLDQQPLLHESAGLILLFDGRLDNREQLADWFGITKASLGNLADSELALRAVLRWDTGAPGRFIGDFALACWQPSRRRLWLARDAIGHRPLYWHEQRGRLAFSSSARSLLTLPGTTSEINEISLFHHLCLLPQDSEDSFFKGIQRVRPGHVSEFIDGRLAGSWCHQRLDDIKPLHLARDEDYVEAMDELMTEVIASHLRSCAPVSSHLSSGFDSSTVTAYAARQLDRQGRRLTAYTVIPRPGFDGPTSANWHADESVGARALTARFANIDHELVDVQAMNWLVHTAQLNEKLDQPVLNPLNALWIQDIERRAQSAGSRIMLTGARGNMTISYDGRCLLPDLLASGHWLAWLRELETWRHRGQTRLALGLSLLPLLPAAVQLRLRSKRPEDVIELHKHSAIHPDFYARMVASIDQATLRVMNYLPPRDSRRFRVHGLTRMDMGGYSLHANLNGVEMRDPTSDLRIIRFCLALPEDQYMRHGQSRWLIRRLTQAFMPPEISACKTRGHQMADWSEHIRRSAGELSARLSEMQGNRRASEYLNLSGLRGLAENMQEADWGSRSALQNYRLKLGRGISTASFIASVEITNQ